jgi:phytoene dehydrogenase-like protein
MLFKKKDKVTASYDVVVIGSGLGGLTAAKKLGLAGRKVLLLESHNKLGGLATWFRRSGGQHIFDVSLHGFPYGMVKTCRKYWTKEIANSMERVEKVVFKNPMFSLETDFTQDDYIRILVDHFKVDKEKVISFFAHLAAMNFYDNSGQTNGEMFEEFFPGREDVVRFLLEPIVYANGSTLEDPAITYGIVFSNFTSKGVYIYRGGTDEMITRMRDNLIETGVDIKMHSLVENIEVEGGAVRGVRLADGSFIECKSVVSNSNLHNTIFKMVDESKWSPDYIAKARAVRLNSSSCQVFMGVKKGESIPYSGELIFYSEDRDFKTDLLLSPQTNSQTFSLYYPDMRPHMPDHYAIVSSLNARYEDWQGLSEQDYEKRKEEVIEKALSCVDKVIPGTRKKIDSVCASTPLTVERYTGHAKGSSFGTKFEGLPVSQNMNQEISGLFHAGSVGIIMSGWLGAANYGVIQSHAVDNYLDKVTL